MILDDIYLVTKKLKPIPYEEVDNLGRQLGITLPVAYIDFITTLGEGFYCGDIRLYSPQRILNEYVEIRQRWNEYWFFDHSSNILTKTQVLSSIILGDNMNGDEFIFYPEHPDKLYVLPNDFEHHIHVLASDFSDLCQWNVREFRTTPEFRSFESWYDRQKLDRTSHRKDWLREDLFRRFAERWPSSPIHLHTSDPEDEYLGFFLQEIGGSIDLFGGNGSQVTLVVYHDIEPSGDVTEFIGSLNDPGFQAEDT